MDSAGPTLDNQTREHDTPAHGERAGATVVLVNLMAGEARLHTERQFRAILGAASPGGVRLICISPDRNESTVARVMAARPDGLIVTGMPPRAAHLRDETLWPTLAGLIDFAAARGVPAIWSCLAAHAAVLHLDGIERRRLPHKLVGLVECVRAETSHPIGAGLPGAWQVPHSRYNEVAHDDLLRHGYEVVSTTASGGVDIFARDTGAPFLFFQGHPEYDEQALLREYRRDIGQFLAGERQDYPGMPENFFGPGAMPALDAFRARAVREPQGALLSEFPTTSCVAELRHGWRDFTVLLYSNWLRHVVAPRAADAAAFARAAGAIILGEVG